MRSSIHEVNRAHTYDWEERDEGLARAHGYLALVLLGLVALMGGALGFVLGAVWVS